MKSRASIFTRVTLAIVFFCGLLLAVSSITGAAAPDKRRDRCKRRCEEVFKARKFECKRFRGRERHRCEDEAKRERNNCKDRCR